MNRLGRIRFQFDQGILQHTNGFSNPPLDYIEEFVRKEHARHSEVEKLKLKNAELQGTIQQWSEYGRKLEAALAGKDAEIKRLKELSRGDETSSTGSNISGLCIVCHGNEANVAMVPCGHVCLCTSCEEEYTWRMSTCPMGCGRYASTLRVFRG